ncbi:MAG TPA: VanZ family protein [Prolixibacteraceae bacterium]|nr:VanZ family protein [Prolixibacteraceae bacterium]HPR86166.1 VanZ family protein [Prolixibacteraceae bacterium]
MISFLLSLRQGYRMAFLIVYISCIMALSLLPPSDLPHVKVFEGFDKVVHFLMYFPLAILLCWNLRADKHPKRIYLAIIFAVGWGLYMEFLQLTMHLGRSFSWYDELANLAGSLFGACLFGIAMKKFSKPFTKNEKSR